MTISYALLKQQNAATSNAIIAHFAAHPAFLELAKYEGDMTVARDKEDDDKLQRGIDFAKKKGVIDKNFKPEPYQEIDVLGKTPDDVANEIIASVNAKNKSNGKSKGSVIVLVGLSGTGKGTTVSKLREKMEKSGKKVVTWSNGNIFRSVTLLAATYAERNDCKKFDQALTKENLADYMSMLAFGKFNKGKYDTRIRGLGLELYVTDVQSTLLKEPKVSKNIPTVAQQTQGEVILFAAKAVELMGQDGLVVLLEGREQTVNYVTTPHRFSLTLSDASLIGKRRAAQRLMGASVKALSENGNKISDEAVMDDLDQQIVKMLMEVKEEEKERGYKGIFCGWGGKK